MIHDVYLLQLGFHPMAVVGKLVKKSLRTKGETIQKIQKQIICKTENKHKTRNKIQRILKT